MADEQNELDVSVAESGPAETSAVAATDQTPTTTESSESRVDIPALVHLLRTRLTGAWAVTTTWITAHRRETAAAVILLMMGGSLMDSSTTKSVEGDAGVQQDLIDVEQIMAEFPPQEFATPATAPDPDVEDSAADSGNLSVSNHMPPGLQVPYPPSESPPFSLPPSPTTNPGGDPAPVQVAAFDFPLRPAVPALPNGTATAARYGELPGQQLAISAPEPKADATSAMSITPRTAVPALQVSPIHFRGGIQPIR